MQSYRVWDNASIRLHDLPGCGPPIVFIHGLGCASSSDYVEVAAQEPLADRRRILIDLLGAGFSDAPSAFSYSVEDHARYIAHLVKSIGAPVILFGHSFGGPIAIVAATLEREFISNLVLGEPNLDPGGGSVSRRIAAMSEEQFVCEGCRQLAAERAAAGADAWASSLLASDPRAIHRGAVSLVEGSSPTWRSLLLGLQIPRAVIFGQKSLPDPDVEALSAAGIPIELVSGAGHDMAIENPLGLATAIERCARQ